MRKRSIVLSLAALGLGLSAAPAATAQAVSFNLIGASYTVNGTLYQNTDNNIDPAAVTGAYPVGDWNNDSGGSTADTITPVYDSGGAATTITFTANAAASKSNKLEATDPNYFNTGLANPNYQLMDGYLQSSLTTPVSIAIGNVPYASYDLYVYLFDGIAATGAYTFTPAGATGLINATTINALSQATFGGSFVDATGGAAGNYIVFHNLSASGFTLTAKGLTTSPGTLVPVNGLQIVAAAPEPSVWAGLALGASAIGLLVARQRKVGKAA